MTKPIIVCFILIGLLFTGLIYCVSQNMNYEKRITELNDSVENLKKSKSQNIKDYSSSINDLESRIQQLENIDSESRLDELDEDVEQLQKYSHSHY